MSNAESIARDYVEGWNRRDWDGWLKMLHPEYTYTGGDGQTHKGPQAALDVGQMFATGFPDGKIGIRQVHTAGDNIAIVEFVARGTHDGELMGIAPTGRKMEMPVCMLVEVKDGKIYAEREYMDIMHLMQQLGVAPAPATA